jgi:hypothetical protein
MSEIVKEKCMKQLIRVPGEHLVVEKDPAFSQRSKRANMSYLKPIGRQKLLDNKLKP